MTYDVSSPSAARLFDYSPDWSSGYDVTRAFRTDICTSRNNTEQRRALRDVPRLSVRYTSPLTDRLAEARGFLRAFHNRPTVTPDYSRHALTTASHSAGNTAITIASPSAWVAPGQVLVLCGTTHEKVIVDDVTGSTISLTAALANAWPSGSVVRPGLFGLLSGKVDASRYRRGAQDMGVQFDVYPGGEPPEDEGAASVTLSGYDVLTAEPNWSGSASMDYLWPVERVDFELGRTAQFRPIDLAQAVVEAEFTGAAAVARSVEQQFLRSKGRRGAFWLPSWESDHVPASNSSGTTITVTGTAAADAYASTDFTTFAMGLAIYSNTGSLTVRKVTDVASSGANSTITVSAATSINTGTITRMSWMPLVRFASDDLTTRWRTPLTASIRTAFQSVRA